MRALARRKLGSEQGQSLVMFVIFLPVLFAFLAFVVDTGHAFTEKRRVQNAADAAALAAAQELVKPECAVNKASMRACLKGVASQYVVRNLPADAVAEIPLPLKRCPRPAWDDDDPPGFGEVAEKNINCYAWPYYDKNGGRHDNQVEVRIHYEISTFFAQVIGFMTPFTPAARAVASALPITTPDCADDWSASNPPSECERSGGQPGIREEHCVFEPPLPGGEDPDQYLDDCVKLGANPTYGEVVEGNSHCVFDPPLPEGEDPDQYVPSCAKPGHEEGGIAGAQAFTMSRSCEAISYVGAGNGGITLGAFATNGGLTFKGNKPKKIDTLGFDKRRCGSLLPEPTSTPPGPNGDPAECNKPKQQFCVRNLVDWSDRVPLNWPVPPPPLPTPLPDGTAWDPSVHYPGSCTLLTDPVSTTVTLDDPWRVTHAPGIYCVSGSTTVLQITKSMTAGDGYTFFALDSARIGISGNGTSVKFYWPSECGPRPTTRTLSFTCFGRTITGYDPLTVLYSTDETPFPATCVTSAICFNGQGGSLDGDVFAPLPNTFPPSLEPEPQGGGTVWVAGGAASAGSGFIESWQLKIEGNGGTYNGTGPVLGGTIVGARQGQLVQETHCQFDPPVDDPDQYLPSCIIPGEGGQQGTVEAHCVFDPPLPPGEDPDDYLDDCVRPGETEYATPITRITGSDISMDE
jgi:hypothetical protein